MRLLLLVFSFNASFVFSQKIPIMIALSPNSGKVDSFIQKYRVKINGKKIIDSINLDRIKNRKRNRIVLIVDKQKVFFPSFSLIGIETRFFDKFVFRYNPNTGKRCALIFYMKNEKDISPIMLNSRNKIVFCNNFEYNTATFTSKNTNNWWGE